MGQASDWMTKGKTIAGLIEEHPSVGRGALPCPPPIATQSRQAGAVLGMGCLAGSEGRR
jgi:hypothetical protein